MRLNGYCCLFISLKGQAAGTDSIIWMVGYMIAGGVDSMIRKRQRYRRNIYQE